MSDVLPALVAKALADNGYDLVSAAQGGWHAAGISGTTARVLIRVEGADAILALPEPGIAERVGLSPLAFPLPVGMHSAGLVRGAAPLYEALRVLHSLQRNPAKVLSAKLETRLAAIPSTERTQEVRQRIGQELFREALFEFWQGRCALSGIELPRQLLRASHAKPWARATDSERLDPFNGLLLAVQFDALFDAGLIAFNDGGNVLLGPTLSAGALRLLGLDAGMRLVHVLPGHVEYLRYHRAEVAHM